MTETPEPPPRHDWEERPAFREIFLAQAPPLAAEALREAGRNLYDALLESAVPAIADEEPWVRARVRAIGADLRFSAEVLASLRETPAHAELSAAEAGLAVKTGAWSDEVLAVVRAIDSELAPSGEPR